MEGLTDKELIKLGKYREALGSNYREKPIYIMLFRGVEKDIKGEWIGFCIYILTDSQDKELHFFSVEDAQKWIDENEEPLPSRYWYQFGNHNHGWL